MFQYSCFGFLHLKKIQVLSQGAAEMCAINFKIKNSVLAERRGAALCFLVSCLSPSCAWKCPWPAVAAQSSTWLTFQITLFRTVAICLVINALCMVLTGGFCIGSSLAVNPLWPFWR